MSYYKENSKPNIQVWYKLLNAKGRIVKSYTNQSCFSAITMMAIPKEAVTVVVFHLKAQVPYDSDDIRRWINDINEMGFPCTYKPTIIKYHQFTIDLNQYQYKSHLIGTLMLIRALYESGICKTPDKYFKIMDENPNTDKFLAMQTAHKALTETGRWGIGYNTNHMITYSGNGDNVDRDTLFGRYKKCGVKVWADTGWAQLHQSDKWIGGQPKVKGCKDCNQGHNNYDADY